MPDLHKATCGQALNLSRNGPCPGVTLLITLRQRNQPCYVMLFKKLALRFDRLRHYSEHWPTTPDFRRLYLSRFMRLDRQARGELGSEDTAKTSGSERGLQMPRL